MAARKKLTPLQARARHIRHFGYVFYASAVLWLAVSMSAGVISGLQDGTARDPFNGELASDLTVECQGWADVLLGIRGILVDAPPSPDKPHPAVAWKVRAEGWKLRCGAVEGDAPTALREAMR